MNIDRVVRDFAMLLKPVQPLWGDFDVKASGSTRCNLASLNLLRRVKDDGKWLISHPPLAILFPIASLEKQGEVGKFVVMRRRLERLRMASIGKDEPRPAVRAIILAEEGAD